MKTEVLYSEKSKCSGCGACVQICPVIAIEMKKDEKGFDYPEINQAICIDCQNCVQICPIKKIKKEVISIEKNKITGYITRSKNLSTLKRASSGGIVSEIGEYVLKNKGVVFGALFDKENNVIHKRIEELEDLKKIAGSKYVQSNLKNTFKECKEELLKNKIVLYIGVPCQIAGLENFLKKEYNNLITISLVCHGVSSPKIWNSYKNYLEKKYNSKIKDINFRNKKFGYRSSGMKISFFNQKNYWASPRIDSFLKLYFMNVISREACLECSFKNLENNSDFIVFDSWKYEKLIKKSKDDNLGYTNLLVKTYKGKNLLNDIKESIEVYEVELKNIIPQDGGMLLNSAISKVDRTQFWNTYLELGFELTLKKYVKISIIDKCIEQSKYILYKLGLMKILSKLQIMRKTNWRK